MSTKTITKIQTINWGQIDFINCLPINMSLASKAPSDKHFKIWQGSPQDLNQRIAKGALDIAPVSSFEYLQNKKDYILLDSVSISSKVEAVSVKLYIKEDLKNTNEIFITDKSATSVNLLKIILEKNHKLNCKEIKFTKFSENNGDMPIKLLIGDEALIEKETQYQQVLDLGEEWHKLTQLPMVFGLWVLRKESNLDAEEMKKLLEELKNHGLEKNYPDLIIEAYKKTGLSRKLLSKYFNSLDYDFKARHRTSLNLFERMLQDQGIIYK